MVTKMFELRQSDKLVAKILVAFFVVALALVMAFAPAVETVALANQVNQVCAAVGTISGMLMGSATFSAMWATAGVTLTIALCSDIAAALICFVVAMGVGMLVSSLVSYITSEKSLDLFDITFWQALQSSWDRAKQKVVCSAAVFQMICAKIKQALGIDGNVTEPLANNYVFITSDTPTIDDLRVPKLTSWTLEENKLPNPLLTVTAIGSIFYGNSGAEPKTTTSAGSYVIKTYRSSGDVYGNICLVVDDATYSFTCGVTFQEACGFVSIPIVNKETKSCWFIASEAWQTYAAGGYRPSIATLSLNGSQLKTDKNNNYCYYDVSNAKMKCYVVDDDGNVIIPNSVENFLYYAFYMNYRPAFAAVENNTAILDNKSNVKDMSDEEYKKVTTKSSDLRKARTRNKDVTYDSKKDRTKSITDAIKSTGKTDVKGKVTLDAVGISDATTIDAVGSLDVSDVIGVVGVGASDISVPDTATGEDVPVDVPTDNVIPFDVGPKLIKFSAEGIADKFPFCLPKFLKQQLNIMVADPKEPKFTIPFEVKSAKLKGDIDLDLTMGGKAKTITNITDFFLCAALVIGLVFATKKLEF